MSWPGLGWPELALGALAWPGLGWLNCLALAWACLNLPDLAWTGPGWPAGLGWPGLAWPGLSWRGLGWSGLGCAGLAWAGLDWPGRKGRHVPRSGRGAGATSEMYGSTRAPRAWVGLGYARAQGAGPTTIMYGNKRASRAKVTRARRAPVQLSLCTEVRAPRARRSTHAT